MPKLTFQDMTKDELISVLQMKDSQIRELKEELTAYAQLVEELNQRLGVKDHLYTGNGD